MLKFKRKNLLLVMLVLIGIIIFTACKAGTDPEETSSGDLENHQEETVEKTIQEVAWTITIETADGESVDFTDLDLEEIGKINMKATIKNKDGTEEENGWTGVQLKKVLEFANVGEYESIEVEARDGFSVEYTQEIANSDKTILAIKKDGVTLDEDSGPAQMVVEGERANLWIRNIAKIKTNK